MASPSLLDRKHAIGLTCNIVDPNQVAACRGWRYSSMLDWLNQQMNPCADNGGAVALARKVNFLSRSDSYVPTPDRVVARETHMSWVFMAGERVYKLKKPVRFPYLDFSTLDRRAVACSAEFSLNRRLAPGVYLGLAPLTATPTGYAIGGGGTIIDWLVVMRRLDESQTLEVALSHGKVSQPQVRRLANILSEFYSHAPRVAITQQSYAATIKKGIFADRRGLLDAAFDLPPATIERIAYIQCRFLRQRADVLAERVHRRFIVDGHGDLRPEHIWLSPPFPIIDCLEFDARLRASDALDEIAFLHLECERLGGRWVGDALRRYLATRLRDNASSGLFLFYRIGRAMLRGRLSIAHLADPHPRTPEKWPQLTRTYLSLASSDAAQLAQLLSKGRMIITPGKAGDRSGVCRDANV
jgi:aminoglycoside phosphotransferase family enzyme